MSADASLAPTIPMDVASELPPPGTTSKPPTPGGPVTLVLPDHVVMCEVAASSRARFTCILTSRTAKSILSEHKVTGEGVSWLHGYHLADSDEVKACRAAKALK